MKEGWEYKKLDEVCYVEYGTRVVQKKDGGTIYPVYGGGGETFRMDRFNRSDSIVIARFAMSKQCTRFVKGKFFLNDSGLTIRSKVDKIAQDFLNWHIIALNDEIYLLGKGMAQKNLDMPSFRNITLKIPPLSEQQHIVEELDLLSSIIEKKKAQLKELDNLAQSLFYEMFGDNADCSTKKIKDIAIVKIGPFGSSLHKSDYVSGGTPLINPIHMSEGKILPDENFTITNEKKKELETYLLQTNDIIFGRRGDIGRCALVTRKENGYLCGTGSLFVRFQVNINPIYCINYLSTRFVKDYLVQNAKGATMLNLNSKIIENVPMLFPSLDLQNQFASKIEAIERQKELIKQSIKEVETLFNSRMDYYFN